MKKIIVLFAIFLCISEAKALAETSIKAQVDKTSMTTDELLTYKITVTSLEKQLSVPRIPEFTGFKVASSSQSSNISFTKGKIRTQIVYEFILATAETGKFKVEPSSVKIGNQTYSSDAFEIEVRQGKFKPPKTTQPESELPRITL